MGGTLPEPDPTETTAEILAQDEVEQARVRMEEFANDRLWSLYANRLTANGSLIR
jgi:hypothetical protein